LRTGVRHQSHEAGVLDGGGDLALVLGAQTGSFARNNLELTRSKFAQQTCVFVINRIYFFLTANTHN